MTAALGSIAKTAAPDGTSLAIIGSFNITAEAVGNATVGDTLNKVGRTTGWTKGTVTNDCVNVLASGTNIILLCQDLVDAGVGGGDSGSPVFQIISGDDVRLSGILWGGAEDGSNFVFSPLTSVESELGPLTTFTGPTPTLQTIDVEPASAEIEVGQTQQFTATGNFSDGSTQDFTNTAAWASSNTAVATINGSGLASGDAVGSSGITAAQDGKTSNSATLTVTEASPPSGTGAIQGRVTDGSNGQKIQGAQVMTTAGQSATTNKGGKYSLGNVPAGVPVTVTVTVPAGGYAPQSSGPITVNAGETVKLDFQLTPQ